MQTLKTTAIIVFLGLVMWGAYTSLTIPPEQLPQDVQELVFDNETAIDFDEQAFDSELADSLPELDIDAGQPLDQPPEASDSLAMANEPRDEPKIAAEVNRQAAVTARLSDTVEPPPAVEQAATVDAAPQSKYVVTPNTFQLPDPEQAAAGFASSNPDLKLPPADAELALTSGTIESDNECPPESEVISTAGSSPKTKSKSSVAIANAVRTADRQYAADQRRAALATLSIFYNTPDLPGQQRAELLARLDPLAREVIYSQEHLLEKPYRVANRETLVEIAQQYQVPWQLLANINRITDPMAILPGTELKVVQGPFRAEVSLSGEELTLFLGDLYAGRFPIAVGSDPPPHEGTFTVQDKQTERTYYDRTGAPVPSGSPNNPYGGAWLDLGGQLCIHGSSDPNKPTEAGCISVADSYAADLIAILSHGSSVTIRR